MFKAFVVAASMMAAGAANATVLSWNASLSGANEVPLIIGPGTGTGTGTYDTATNLLSWMITYSNLTGPATGMHFHQAPAGSNGGVVVNIGSISGLLSPSSGSTTITEAAESEFLAGNWYINIHTAARPSGEIRGQVSVAPVPVPGAAGLALAGLGSLVVLSRRRRAKRDG